MTVIEILRAARAKLSDPKHWTTGVMARDANGLKVLFRSPAAVCFCALGAMRSETTGPTNEAFDAESFLESAALVVDPGADGPADINDRLGHEAVLEMYDIAIAQAEGM